jgi:hypothetical protein
MGFKDIANVPLDRDFFAEVALGKVSGWTRQIFKGFCPAATAGSYVWTGGAFAWRTTPTAVEVLSSSVNDAAAGTGARTILVSGVGTSYAATSETVTLNGTSVVALVNQYIHINNVKVVTAGSGKTNAGAITVRIASAGATMGHIAAIATSSQNCQIMAPAGFAYLSLNQVIGTSSATNLNVHTFVQELFSNTGILTIDNVFHISTNGTTPFVLPQDIPLILNEKMAIAWKMSAIGSGTPDITARIQGMFVDLSKGY